MMVETGLYNSKNIFKVICCGTLVGYWLLTDIYLLLIAKVASLTGKRLWSNKRTAPLFIKIALKVIKK